jgi:predicted Zn-ribbon and HTH transcriptional regulator
MAKGDDWTRENLIAELRYLASAITYDVDADTGQPLVEPVDCERCGLVYDEACGEGYCGLCPTCADETEEPDTTNYQETAFREA